MTHYKNCFMYFKSVPIACVLNGIKCINYFYSQCLYKYLCFSSSGNTTQFRTMKKTLENDLVQPILMLPTSAEMTMLRPHTCCSKVSWFRSSMSSSVSLQVLLQSINNQSLELLHGTNLFLDLEKKKKSW